MRIKDLATRATKLLAGNSWFAVDNGSKVDKVGYSAMVKEAIEEYNGTSLAGSNQSVKSAVDALNSKTVYIYNAPGTYDTQSGMWQIQSSVDATAYYPLFARVVNGTARGIVPYFYQSGATVNFDVFNIESGQKITTGNITFAVLYMKR